MEWRTGKLLTDRSSDGIWTAIVNNTCTNVKGERKFSYFGERENLWIIQTYRIDQNQSVYNSNCIRLLKERWMFILFSDNVQSCSSYRNEWVPAFSNRILVYISLIIASLFHTSGRSEGSFKNVRGLTNWYVWKCRILAACCTVIKQFTGQSPGASV